MIASKQLASLNSNPIARAEMLHQERSNGHLRRWRRWLIYGVFILALEVAMIYFWGEFTGALLWRDTSPLYQGLMGPLSLLMICVALTAHLIVLLRTLALASTSIVQEKERRTWEALVLTGVTSRQLVVGKWWATLRTMGRSYLGLAALRSGLVVFLGASVSSLSFSLYSNSSYITVPPHPLLILLAGVLMLVFTLMAGALTAAVGVLASLIARRVQIAVITGIALSVLLMIASALSLTFVVSLTYRSTCSRTFGYGPCSDLVEGLDATALSIADNGTSAASSLAQHITRYRSQELAYRTLDQMNINGGTLLAGLMIPAFYLFATLGALRLAEWRARRQGILTNRVPAKSDLNKTIPAIKPPHIRVS